LLDVATGKALWADSFEEPLAEVLDFIAGRIVSALQIELTDRDRERLFDGSTDNVKAWELYANGRFHWERKTPEDFRRAIDDYQAAEKLVPAVALAAVGQADCWAVLGLFNAMPPVDAFAYAAVAARRALQLAPDSAEAMAAVGHVLVHSRRDWAGGERLYRRALAAKARFAQCRMWLANDCAFQGRLHEALVEARRAQQLEPMSLTFAANVGFILYLTRDFSAALRQLEPLVKVAPEFPLARLHLARTLIASNNPEGALALLGPLTSRGPFALSLRGCALAAMGRREQALAEIARLEAEGRKRFSVAFDLAMIHARLGNSDEALNELERAAGDLSQQFGFLTSEPALDSVRDDPRFRAVSRQIGLG
jgi:tetratricopeptide (TPR) repeat protein